MHRLLWEKVRLAQRPSLRRRLDPLVELEGALELPRRRELKVDFNGKTYLGLPQIRMACRRVRHEQQMSPGQRPRLTQLIKERIQRPIGGAIYPVSTKARRRARRLSQRVSLRQLLMLPLQLLMLPLTP